MLTYDPDYYVGFGMPEMVGLGALLGETVQPHKYSVRKHVNSWVVGASFAVTF